LRSGYDACLGWAHRGGPSPVRSPFVSSLPSTCRRPRTPSSSPRSPPRLIPPIPRHPRLIPGATAAPNAGSTYNSARRDSGFSYLCLQTIQIAFRLNACTLPTTVLFPCFSLLSSAHLSLYLSQLHPPSSSLAPRIQCSSESLQPTYLLVTYLLASPKVTRYKLHVVIILLLCICSTGIYTQQKYDNDM